MSQELDWELGDIFDGGIFAFPVDDPSAARAVVRYLLMRGVLLEEIAASIDQPGSTSDLAAWLSGDERKSMIGVWATAWLNDARRRHDTDRRRRTVGEFRSSRRQQVVVVVGDTANGGDEGNGSGAAESNGKRKAVSGGGWRQASLDSDFGGSEEESYAASGGGASRTNSLEGGLEETSSPVNGSCSTDDDEIGNSCALQRRRRRRPLSSSADDVTDDRVSGAAIFVTSLPDTTANSTDTATKYVLLRSHTSGRRGCRDDFMSSRLDADNEDSQFPIRPRSEIYESISGYDEFCIRPDVAVGAPLPVVPLELLDSGNVSEMACSFETIEKTVLCDDIDDVIDITNDVDCLKSLSDDLLRRSTYSKRGAVLCQCTFSQFTATSAVSDRSCKCDESVRVVAAVANDVTPAKQVAELS